MDKIKISFVISELSEHDVASMQAGHAVITKMILSSEDFQLFKYKEGDGIQVETADGNRLWGLIQHLEIVEHSENVILIFTLVAK